jgi:hypothetical protein
MKFQTLKYSAPLRNIQKNETILEKYDNNTTNPYGKIPNKEPFTIIKIAYNCCEYLSTNFNYIYQKYVKTKPEVSFIEHTNDMSKTLNDSYVLMSDNN